MAHTGDRAPWPIKLPPGIVSSYFRCGVCDWRTIVHAAPEDAYVPRCSHGHALTVMAPCPPFRNGSGDRDHGEDVPQ